MEGGVSHRSEAARRRAPVGVPPYRAPPLSGLYRMHYSPPSPADETSLAHHPPHAAAGGDASPAAVRHAAVHAQLLRASSLDDGGVDLFALYSVCDLEPVPCTHCTLHTQVTFNTCSFRLRQTYRPPGEGEAPAPRGSSADERGDGVTVGSSALVRQLQRGWYVFFFPLSECGRIKDNLLVCVDDALMAGDVAECDLGNGGFLRPLRSAAARAAAAAAGSGATAASPHTQSTPPRWKPLFYYVVSPIRVRGAAATARDLQVSVSWRSSPAAADEQARTRRTSLTLLYSYYCSPRAPDVLTCRAQFRGNACLRLVRSPNCDDGVQLRSDVTESAARVSVETMDGRPLELHRHPRDYTFALQFYFGPESGLAKETSALAAAVVAVVSLLLLWMFLTKDLVL